MVQTTLPTFRSRAMTIGQLSRRTGVSIKLLRDYERLGFLYTRGRSESNYRLFGEETLWCVQLVQQLRSLGLTLKEIQELLTVYGEDKGPSESLSDLWDALLTQVAARVEARIADLQALRQRIRDVQATQTARTCTLDTSDRSGCSSVRDELARLVASDPCSAGDVHDVYRT